MNAAPPPDRRGIDIGDFRIARGRVTLRLTGNSATIDRRLLAEVATWVGFYLVVRLRALRRAGRKRRSIWFAPQVPHPRYMVRIAAIAAGIRVARSPAEADAAFFFDDATASVSPTPGHARAFNFGCGDISKSRVAAVFEAVFGYPLAVDPRTWVGPAVAKSEANGTHDGRIVTCPRRPLPGMVYQRVIDTVQPDGLATDLRTSVVGGRAVAVWVKRRTAAARFLPPNVSAEFREPATVFSRDELDRIGAFAAAMGADWCGLDILRDRDGRIYIVDVNKTDAGPIIALPLRAKLAAVDRLAAALRGLIAGERVAGDGVSAADGLVSRVGLVEQEHRPCAY